MNVFHQKPVIGFWFHLHVQWVVPEKIRTPPTDGILEILVGGGDKDPGNLGRRGG